MPGVEVATSGSEDHVDRGVTGVDELFQSFHPEKRAWLEANIERVRPSSATRMTREEFLVAIEPITEEPATDDA